MFSITTKNIFAERTTSSEAVHNPERGGRACELEYPVIGIACDPEVSVGVERKTSGRRQTVLSVRRRVSGEVCLAQLYQSILGRRERVYRHDILHQK